MELLPKDEIAAVEAQAPGPLAVLPREKVHTAARLDQATRDSILAKFATGKSRKTISLELRISRNTVAAVISEAEASGALPRWQDRVARKMEELVEDTLIEWTEKGRDMSSVDVAIMVDKRNLLQGAATVRHDVVIRREDESAILDDLKKLAEGVIDVEATPLDPPPTP